MRRTGSGAREPRCGHNGVPMFRHVIVPFDGRSLEGRSALAPAADLAWRCGAKVVIVTTSSIDDEAVKIALKSQAIAKSGADVDFWVDLDTDIGSALMEAAAHREGSVICVASRPRAAGVMRKKRATSPFPDGVFARSPVPVLVIGPETELSRGLPLASLFVPINVDPESVQAVGLSVELAEQLRLGVNLLHFVAPGGSPRPPEAVAALVAAARERLPHTTFDVIETADPAAALVAIAAEDDDGAILLPRTGARAAAAGLDGLDEAVIATSARAVFLPAIAR